jgi:hypothetical protein
MKNKTNRKLGNYIITIAIIFLTLLLFMNPNRGTFNKMVFEVITTITSDETVKKEIREVNGKDYGVVGHPLVKRRNYFIFSIYDVRVQDNKTYHIVGFLGTFRLLN